MICDFAQSVPRNNVLSVKSFEDICKDKMSTNCI